MAIGNNGAETGVGDMVETRRDDRGFAFDVGAMKDNAGSCRGRNKCNVNIDA